MQKEIMNNDNTQEVNNKRNNERRGLKSISNVFFATK